MPMQLTQDKENLRITGYARISQLHKEIPHIYTLNTLRVLFTQRKRNGLDKCTSKLNGKLLVNKEEFYKWLKRNVVSDFDDRR
jgi:hypothetical protein